MWSSIFSFITDIITNAYVVGGVGGIALHRWVLPPVAEAVVDDVKALWAKMFTPKQVTTA